MSLTLDDERIVRIVVMPGGALPSQVNSGSQADAIDDAFELFNVIEFAFDPPGWYSEGDEWASKYGGAVVEFETKQPSRFAPACERTRTAMNEGSLTYGGPLAAELAGHFGNCVAVETPPGMAVRKDHPDSPRKIDGAVSVIIGVEQMAWHTAHSREPLVAWA